MANFSLDITYETVTPLFMGGANQKQPPEIRPSAIRAALRFWWRALWAGTHPPDALEMSQKEAELFGSNTTASPIVVRVTGQPQKHAPHKFRQHPGLDYLFFAFRPTRNEQPRSGFHAGEKFGVKIAIRPGAKFSDHQWQQVCAAVWLFSHFGSLGSRSRRGAGCITASKTPKGDWPEGFPPLTVQAENAGGVIKDGREGVFAILNGLEWNFSEQPNQPQMSILHPGHAGFYVIGKAYIGWQLALDDIGSKFQALRQAHAQAGNDRDVKLAALGRGDHIDSVDRAAFGLPIVFFYKGEGSGMLQGDKNIDRRGSPISMRVVKLANGSYINLLIHFNAQFLPQNTQMLLKGRKVRGRVKVDPPPPDLIYEFINSISHEGFNPDLFIAKRRSIKLDWRPSVAGGSA